jgi:hypothetical protein
MVPIFPAMPNGVAKIGNSVVYPFLYLLFNRHGDSWSVI